MREEAVRKLLTKAESDWGTIEKLIEENKLIELRYLGDKFYMSKLLGRF